MIRKTALLLLLCIVLAGCTFPGEKPKIRETVLRYNQLLAQGYRDLNMNPLAGVAEPEVAQKAYHHMAAYAEGGLRIDSTLKKIEFKKIDLQKSGLVAVVETEELWDFAQRDIKTGKTFSEETDFIYDMGYELRKNGDTWTITSVNAIHTSSSASRKNK